MNERKFYMNLLGFFVVGIVWVILDVITDNTTSLTHIMIWAFFIVWNANQCAKPNKTST
jgi:hypothetical protein